MPASAPPRSAPVAGPVETPDVDPVCPHCRRPFRISLPACDRAGYALHRDDCPRRDCRGKLAYVAETVFRPLASVRILGVVGWPVGQPHALETVLRSFELPSGVRRRLATAYRATVLRASRYSVPARADRR